MHVQARMLFRHGVHSVQKEKPRASSYCGMVHTIYNNSIGLLTMSLDSAPKVLFRYLMDKSGDVADVDEERVECEASFRWAMTHAGACKRAYASAPSDAAVMYAGLMHNDTLPAHVCVCTHATGASDSLEPCEVVAALLAHVFTHEDQR
jgi:hypothetical protein